MLHSTIVIEVAPSPSIQNSLYYFRWFYWLSQLCNHKGLFSVQPDFCFWEFEFQSCFFSFHVKECLQLSCWNWFTSKAYNFKLRCSDFSSVETCHSYQKKTEIRGTTTYPLFTYMYLISNTPFQDLYLNKLPDSVDSVVGLSHLLLQYSYPQEGYRIPRLTQFSKTSKINLHIPAVFSLSGDVHKCFP